MNLHPRCRCSSIPCYEDDKDENNTRFARDKNGKRIEVPSNMKYEEFADKYINKDYKEIAEELSNRKPKDNFETYKDNYKKLTTNKDNKEYVNKTTDILKAKYPKEIQNAYLKAGEKMTDWLELDTDEAYFIGGKNAIGGQNAICLNAKRRQKIAKEHGFSEYEVWFHENGHAIDTIIGGDKKISSDKNFIKTLYKDFENMKKNIFIEQNKRLINKERNTIRIRRDEYDLDEYIKGLSDKDLYDLFSNQFRGKDKTHGIQDIISGITNSKVSLKYSHSKDYWNRDNREEEVASESWANILGSMCDDETYEYMNKYFPNSVEWVNKTLKEKIKKEK